MQTKSGTRSVWLCLVWGMALLLGSMACGLSPLLASQTTPTVLASATARHAVGSTMTETVSLPPSPVPTLTDYATKSPETSELLIYLVAVEDNGASGKLVGCGDSLVSVKRHIAPTRYAMVAALTELFAIKEQHYGESGLYNALFQSDLRVESVEVDENGIATVVLTGQVMLGGMCDTPRFIGQIEETILAVAGVQSVNILLNGKPINEALSTR